MRIISSYTLQNYAAPLAVALAFFIIHFVYIDVFWYAPDEGVFAYFADLINQGKIYGVDFHGLQPGYHALWNAFLFDLFGRDLVNLRIPLVILFSAMAGMTTYLLRRRHIALAVTGGLWIGVFGLLQFINPSANWYAYCFAFFVIVLLIEVPNTLWRNLLIGVLIGLCLGFRHPSAVFLGAGTIMALICQLGHRGRFDMARHWLGKVLALLILAGLMTFVLVFNDEPLVIFYIGIWPVLICLLVLKDIHIDNVALFRTGWPMLLGFLAGIVPLIIYQLAYGDLGIWAQTSLMGAANLLNQPFFDDVRYWHIVAEPAGFFIQNPGVLTFLNIVFWAIILAIIPLAGAGISIRLWRGRVDNVYLPLLIIPLFYGYVSIYFQIYIYLVFSLGLYGLALMSAIGGRRRMALYITGAVLFVCLFSFIVTVARPLDGNTRERVRSGFDGANLWISRSSYDRYAPLLNYITDKTRPQDSIFVFPANPEIYFLSRRENPTPYFSTAHAVTAASIYEDLIVRLDKAEPELIIVRPGDKYFGQYEVRLVAALSQELGYQKTAAIDHFDIYRKAPQGENELKAR